MSQFGKRLRYVIVKDYVFNIWVFLIDDVMDCWIVVRVEESMKVMLVLFFEINVLYVNDRMKRIMGGDIKSNSKV